MCPEATEPAKPLSERGKLILSAAQKLFLQHGFDNTSLEMIIAESGGSRRNIYSEFGNKAALLNAVIQDQVSKQVITLTEIDYHLPPKQALTQVCTRFVQGLLSDTLLALFRLVVNVIPSQPEIGELIYQRGPMTGPAPIKEYLEYLHKQNKLDVDDSTFAAQLLIEMVKGRLHIRGLLHPYKSIPQQEVKTHIEKAVDVFLKAYQVKG